ncbi:hypothetical protein SODALDRAFT_264534, partial [Sodiomyces alkalinus F11]
SADQRDHDQQDEPVLYDDGKGQYHRPKDAGKTCKERFSYSSFDAGATVLKTSDGAKNAKAILVENKDSYMLLECAAENKFVIVELTDDILVDTVVIANFEFFSSMIRQFRVSVSDRYPVKMDKWKDLGVFEAKNSRDIQSFLVPNPLIWAKYVRIEFLSHYGNEYYCPVSLLRIHGTRMLESWKETEAGSEDDEAVEANVSPSEETSTPARAGYNTLIQEEDTERAQPSSAHSNHDAHSPMASGDSSQANSRPSPAAQGSIRSRNGTSTSTTPPSPTVQESFHKAISKRLQLLESNVTLSLKYLDEQSRFLQHSQLTAEKRQLMKVDLFLDRLNRTVLSELRSVRMQYEQMWQSTVIALERQRELSEREAVALSTRLNVLADEVVFQKRMAILQAILLLSCLALVIFSR